MTTRKAVGNEDCFGTYIYSYCNHCNRLCNWNYIGRDYGQVTMTEREKHRWIPVSERLPDNDNYVLVLKRSVYEPIVIAFFTSQFGGMSWIDCDNDCINTHDVLAWQKLPEIPEEYRHD